MRDRGASCSDEGRDGAANGSSAASVPPVASWDMNEASGQTVRDSSAQTLDGMLGATIAADANDPAWSSEGPWLRFQPGSYVRVPRAAALEPAKITVEAWVSTQVAQNQYVIAKGQNAYSNASYAIADWGGSFDFYVATQNGVFHSPSMPPLAPSAAWHHVAGSYDGARVRLFVDGVEIGAGTPASGAIAYALPDSNDLVIGAYGPGAFLP